MDDGTGATTLTVAEYLADWLATVVKPNRRPNTYSQYESICRLHIGATLGPLTLTSVTPHDVQRMVSQLTAGGMQARMVRQCVMVLSSALARAERWDMIPRNPVRHVELPAYRNTRPRPLTRAEAQRFIVACRGAPRHPERLEALYLLALTIGLRRGEVAGLQWPDVDWDAGRLSIDRALVTVNGRVGLGPLKTAASRRVVTVPTVALDGLRRRREAQEVERWRTGTRDWQDNGLVFCTSTGRPLHPVAITTPYRRILKRAGIPLPRRFHDLRHTAATLMMEAGVNPRIVQATLGHASLTETLAIYTHVSSDAQSVAATAMGELLGNGG